MGFMGCESLCGFQLERDLHRTARVSVKQLWPKSETAIRCELISTEGISTGTLLSSLKTALWRICFSRYLLKSQGHLFTET